MIGAGQAGLSAAHHLARRGFEPDVDLRVVDAETGPGGAWRHRWPTLTMDRVNGLFDLPGHTREPIADDVAARDAVPAWLERYEDRFDLRVRRPVRVSAVREVAPGAGREEVAPGAGREEVAPGAGREEVDDPDDDRLEVVADIGTWRTRALVNATGTWSRPFWPTVPGATSFTGRQLHTADYPGPDPFAGRRVVVVGGGISALGHLVELSEASETLWVTRREPTWRTEDFTPEHGREVVARVERRVRAGLRPMSVVSETGLPDEGRYAAARRAGVLERHPMFARLTPSGVAWDDGSTWDADVILWATGFRAAVDHLAPLGLRTAQGGIRVEGTRAAEDPRVHLVGYGPSASTVGANRAGRDAAIELARWLRPRATLHGPAPARRASWACPPAARAVPRASPARPRRGGPPRR